MYDKVRVGTCSNCGGPVSVHRYWSSVEPDVPTCESCGARAAQHGPVIPMEPKRAGRKCDGPCFCTGACRGYESPGTMFIGPGLVPYATNTMVRLDPEAAKILADNLWDLYTRSDE